MHSELEQAIFELSKTYKSLQVLLQLTSGKEATVSLVRKDKDFLALKVYKDHTQRSFQSNQTYLAGKLVHKHSEQKAMQKRNKFGRDLAQKLWVKSEFYLMKKLYDQKANIPMPVAMSSNAVLMEYIGDEQTSAPRLKDVTLDKSEAEAVYKKLLHNIELFYKSGIVHGDLSAYNVLYWQGKVYIIDFPQALDIRNNPNVVEALQRDKANIHKWYETNT